MKVCNRHRPQSEAAWAWTTHNCESRILELQLSRPTPSIIWFSSESNRVFIGLKVLYWGEQTILRSQWWNKCFTIDLLQRRQSLLTLVFQAANIKMHLTTQQTVKVCVHVTERFCHKHPLKHKGYLHFYPHTVARSLHFMAQRTSKQWDAQTPKLEQGRLVGHCGVF